MKNKKEFFGVLFSVLISVFLVFLGVYATTTVGNDINIGDDLIITGNNIDFGNGASISNSADAENLVLTETLIILSGKASVSSSFYVGTYASVTTDLSVDGDLLVDYDGAFANALQVGSNATVAYSRFGTGTTGHSLADNDDLLITGLLEVDDAVFFDNTASVTYTNDATGTGAEAALEMTVTDTSDISGGLNRGIYVNYTHQTDNMTGNSEINPLAVDMSVQSDVPYAYATSLYTSSSGDPTVGFLAALSIYMDDPGSATGALVGIDIGLAGGSNSPSDRHAFIRMRNHTGAQPPESLIRVEGTPTADYLFSFENAASSPVSHGTACNTDGVDSDGALKIYAGSTVYYVPYYTAANCGL